MSEGDSAGRAATRRWRAAAGFVVSIVGSAIGLHRLGVTIPSHELALGGAFTLVIVGVVAGGRNLVQRKVPYRGWRDPTPSWSRVLAFHRNWQNPDPGWTSARRRRLDRLTATNGRIALSLIATGLWFVSHPQNWLQLCVTVLLGWVFIKAAFDTNDLLQVPGAPPRASDLIEGCEPVKRIRRRLDDMETGAPFLLGAYKVLFSKTPRHELSGLAVVLVLMFPVVAIGHLIASVSDITDRIPHAKPQQPRHSGKPTHTSPGPSRAPTPRPVPTPGQTPRVPEYEQLCGTNVVPGDGAPFEQRIALRRAWASFGGAVAGCAQRARRVPGSDAYYVLGYLRGEFASLAVAAPGRPAEVLLGSPAALARRLAEAGTLRGASGRLSTGAGDFHVIETTAGGWVVIRPDTSTDSAYVQLPPGLADLWLRFGERFERSWPRQDGSPGHFAFYRQNSSQTRLAIGFCAGDRDCKLLSRHIFWSSPRRQTAQPVTALRVLRYGPGP